VASAEILTQLRASKCGSGGSGLPGVADREPTTSPRRGRGEVGGGRCAGHWPPPLLHPRRRRNRRRKRHRNRRKRAVALALAPALAAISPPLDFCDGHTNSTAKSRSSRTMSGFCTSVPESFVGPHKSAFLSCNSTFLATQCVKQGMSFCFVFVLFFWRRVCCKICLGLLRGVKMRTKK